LQSLFPVELESVTAVAAVAAVAVVAVGAVAAVAAVAAVVVWPGACWARACFLDRLKALVKA
jgi:hypothetical protein